MLYNIGICNLLLFFHTSNIVLSVFHKFQHKDLKEELGWVCNSYNIPFKANMYGELAQ